MEEWGRGMGEGEGKEGGWGEEKNSGRQIYAILLLSCEISHQISRLIVMFNCFSIGT